MHHYVWDAGVYVGHIIYAESKIAHYIDKEAVKCNRFVNEIAPHHKNFMASCTFKVAENAVRNIENMTKELILALGPTQSSSLLDSKRGMSTLIEITREMKSEEAVEGLLKILAGIRAKHRQLIQHKKLDIFNENLHASTVTQVCTFFPVDKREDGEAYSAAMWFHRNKNSCIFITLDRKDFKTLDRKKMGENILYETPDIHFIQELIPDIPDSP